MIELIDPKIISKKTTIITELSNYGINHLSSKSALGWNYVLDHVWLTEQIEAYLNHTYRRFPLIMDVGCGNSLFHNYLENKFNVSIIGIDRPFGYCHQEKTRNVDYLIDFLEFEYFEDHSVDVIYWLSSIEHNDISTVEKLVQKSMGLLRPGGMLLITFPISEETFWFQESMQTNFSLLDAKKVFQEEQISGDFKIIKDQYKNNVLLLKDKYTDRYGGFDTTSPNFIVAGVRKDIPSQIESDEKSDTDDSFRQPFLFYPSNDTHVHWMLPLAKILTPNVFVVNPSGFDENSQLRLSENGYPFYEYSKGLLFKIKPCAIILGNDWSSQKELFLAARKLQIPTICIQEGVLDFVTKGSTRMMNADYAFIQGPIMSQFLRRPRVKVTGNPKYDLLTPMPLPQIPKIMINSNFTYGVFESARGSWIQDVIDACREEQTPFFISMHPRDHGKNPESIEVINSNAYSISEQLENSSILITRFSTLIYEAIITGREVIYYNPHGENFGLLFDDDTKTVHYAHNLESLKDCIKEAKRRLTLPYANINKQKFLLQHINTIDQNATLKCAEEIKKVVILNKMTYDQIHCFYQHQIEQNQYLEIQNNYMSNIINSVEGRIMRKILNFRNKVM